MQGILVEKAETGSRFVTTDGYTMGILETDQEFEPGYYDVIAETKTNFVLQRNTEFEFPDYKPVIPKGRDESAKKQFTCNKDNIDFSKFAATIIRMLPDTLGVNLDFLKKVYIPRETYKVSVDDGGPILFENCTKTFLVMPARL